MHKSQRKLLGALSRALKAAGAEYEVENQPDGAAAVQFAVPAQPSLQIRALVLDDRLVVFYLEPDFIIPQSHLEAALRWAIETNSSIFAGAVEVDPDDGAILFRHSVDCVAVPDAALQAHFTAGLELVTTLWQSIAPTLLPVLAADGDASAHGADSEEVSALVHVDADSEDDDVAQQIADMVYKLLTDGFDEEMAESLSGASRDLAETYVEWLGEAHSGEVDIDARLVGSEEGAVLTLSAENVSPLRYRFSPKAVWDQLARDAEGLTLLHYASPEDAERIVNAGFQDGTLRVAGAYTMDAQGLPIDQNAAEEIEGVLLTDAPLAPDDRRGRTVLVTIAWGEDAPPLGDYERAETAYSGGEAWPLVRDVRRWHVPAKVLNDAVRDGLAEVRTA